LSDKELYREGPGSDKVNYIFDIGKNPFMPIHGQKSNREAEEGK